jgi:uncharacterized caspase-like protein
MTPQFENGYALVIGVDENSVPRWSLPDVAKDVAAMVGVLTHPERCAYPVENVKLFQGKDATRTGILAGLRWLRERLQASPGGNTTGVVYYSGHGWRDTATTPDTYYLIPYDVDDSALTATALRAEDFAAAVSALKPRRLLVVLDACRAGGMGVKDVAAADIAPPPPGYAPAALPVGIFLAPPSGAPAAGAAKDIDALAQGAGRAVLSSSTGDQRSYMRIDGKMSIFTYHLIEALTGHTQPPEGASEVLVTDVMSYVARQVPVSARNQAHAQQQPDFQLSGGSWPVAALLGGKGLSKGVEAPDPLVPPSVAAPVATTQVNTGGGAYVGGNVSVGRDFVGRDKIVHGDEVHGDKVMGNKVGGDKITAGDISGTGIAIGRGAQAHVKQGINGAELERLFAPLVSLVQEQPPDKRGQAEQKVEQLKEEVAKGKSRDDSRMGRLIQGLVDLVPGAVGTVVSMFATPILGGLAGPVTKFVLDGLKGR